MIYFIKLLIDRINKESFSIFLHRAPTRFVYVYTHYCNLCSVRLQYLFFVIKKTMSDNKARWDSVLQPQKVQCLKEHSDELAIKPSVLFVAEKWCDANPALGPTNSVHNLFSTLELSGYATYSPFHFDEYYSENKCSGDNALLAKCLKEKFALLVLTWFFGKTKDTWLKNPRLETLRIIRERLGIPIIAIWFDSANPHVMDVIEMVEPFVDLNVVIDSTASYLARAKNLEKYMSLWTPQDQRIFFNPSRKRDIDVSFVGSRKNYSDRELFLGSLINAGIDVYLSGGQRENRLSVEDYAEIFQRSKISINFSNYMTSTTIKQYKGRIFEATLCGSLLLELENDETAKWFEPMKEYVTFSDEKDLVNKVQYYLEHEEERQEIAMRGYLKAISQYTGTDFWHEVFKRVLPGCI